MTKTVLIVSVAYPAGHGKFQPGTICAGVGETFDEALASIQTRVAAGVRYDDAKTLEVDFEKGSCDFRPALGKLKRHGYSPGELVCPTCGSTEIRVSRGGEDPELMTCDKECYGSGGNPRWMFDGYLDPDGEGPQEGQA